MSRKVQKTPTGIQGLDEITGGGLPAGRPTLLSGGAGSGKTLLTMEFLVNGARKFGENGVFVSFDEDKNELFDNVSSLGFDVDALEKEGQLLVRDINLETQDTVEVGSYNLEGLFVQLEYLIDQVSAKRVVIDGIEALFSSFNNEAIIRKELKRLLRWLKEKGVTAIVTSERGEHPHGITRHGIEEYVSDCVIFMDHRIVEQIATRRLRIIKYRGSNHGTNEYPFIVTGKGISVLPVTSMNLDYDASEERISTGNETLDEMFGGKGFYRGSSVLITGTAGTGKSSVAANFAKSVCESGETCLYFAFEESAKQIVRNMGAIGIHLQPCIERGALTIHAVRPMLQGLERHLMVMHEMIDREAPDAVILDPISNLDAIGNLLDVKLMFLRLIDHLKKKGITALFTDLTQGAHHPEATDVGVSSVMDTWILLQYNLKDLQRQRSVYIMKSRGIRHTHQIHTFEITDTGIHIGKPVPSV